MKKMLVFLCFIFGFGTIVSAQQKIPTPEIEVVKDKFGNPMGIYLVSFYKVPGSPGHFDFDFYLSYKGKRVSDYYHMNFWQYGYHRIDATTWPGEVPKGHEKYVTVQLGKEPEKKDRRDDD